MLADPTPSPCLEVAFDILDSPLTILVIVWLPSKHSTTRLTLFSEAFEDIADFNPGLGFTSSKPGGGSLLDGSSTVVTGSAATQKSTCLRPSPSRAASLASWLSGTTLMRKIGTASYESMICLRRGTLNPAFCTQPRLSAASIPSKQSSTLRQSFVQIGTFRQGNGNFSSEIGILPKDTGDTVDGECTALCLASGPIIHPRTSQAFQPHRSMRYAPISKVAFAKVVLGLQHQRHTSPGAFSARSACNSSQKFRIVFIPIGP
mmetsp:Transcript_31843/g.74415  ORF Transcript_31843/g.74415 Transcript_31843/m.74415 type:complete len:261 (+) Transcript_31843:812-1594(+)